LFSLHCKSGANLNTAASRIDGLAATAAIKAALIALFFMNIRSSSPSASRFSCRILHQPPSIGYRRGEGRSIEQANFLPAR